MPLSIVRGEHSYNHALNSQCKEKNEISPFLEKKAHGKQLLSISRRNREKRRNYLAKFLGISPRKLSCDVRIG